MDERQTMSSGYGQTLPLPQVRITGRRPHPLPPHTPRGYYSPFLPLFKP